MIKYEFRCRASQQEQAALWKVKLLSEPQLHSPAAFPHRGWCPPEPLGSSDAAPRHFGNPESSFPSLTKAFASENACFVCDNAN